MNNRSPLFMPMLPLLAVSSLLHAEGSLSPVVVTATRNAQSAAETLAALTVVTREDIERSQAQSLTDLGDGRSPVRLSGSR